jgi:hypothetical protein
MPATSSSVRAFESAAVTSWSRIVRDAMASASATAALND